MNKADKIFLNLILLILSILPILISCGGKKDGDSKSAAPPPAYVTVLTVKDTQAAGFDEYPGILSALNEVRITAQVSGSITGIYFQDGSKVVKGQKLYSIDQQVYQANLQQAVANQQVQETNLLKAQKDAERYHELDRHDAVAKQQVDYADAALEAAKKQVAASKANVQAVRANVNFSVISAPFTGTIGISQVKVGTAVVAGQTLLNTVSTDDPIAVDINVQQQDIFRFLQIQQKPSSPSDSNFVLAFNGGRYNEPGQISLIDRAVDPQTGTIKARLVFPNRSKMLKAGMNATVRVKTEAERRVISIPYKAVTEQLGEFFAYVVGDSNKVSQRRLELGTQSGVNVIVRSGLKPGDRIVTEGTQNLRQGSVITTTPPPPPGDKKQ